MADALTCDDIALGVETIERMKYVQLDDGTWAKRVVMADSPEDALTCDDAVHGSDTWILLHTVKVGDGEYADLVYPET